ncbi:hypothetical protein [Aquimonas voraii]|uniref:hypothetical protein n=1 Tax=Aquimonas voraii TaxID=265719 RepID=UPI00115FCA22|nr:hypothetical protein [Aquimonas voraii]
MAAIETDTVLSNLTDALRNLAAATSDSTTISAAGHYARLLQTTPPSRCEDLVRRISDELNSPKTFFTDSLDNSDSFRSARDAAYVAAKAAVNHYVCLRRPDLAAVVRAGREA